MYYLSDDLAERIGCLVGYGKLPTKAKEEGEWRPRVKPFMLYFMIVLHVLSAIGFYLAVCHEHWLRGFAELLILYQVTGFGITVGAHRLWSHRSYKASAPMRFLLMLLSSAGHQGSILHWSRDHRLHHKFSETDADPHNAKRGLWFSHIGWLLVNKHPDVLQKGNQLDLSDLTQDPMIMFQHRHYRALSNIFCYLIPGLYGYLRYDSFWLGVLFFGFMRHMVLLHATWLVNSIAHTYGYRPYDTSISPTESFLTSLSAMGEGWHNWHHTYPFDYAASEYGIFGRYNPSKLFIDLCAWLGLASDRKRATHLWAERRRRLEQRRTRAGEN